MPDTSSDTLSLTAHATRLEQCGFACFSSGSAPDAETVRYAEYEFQLYTLHARWLARLQDGDIVRASSQRVNDDLHALAAGLRLGDPWNPAWDACLNRWLDPTDPEGPYICPVRIDCVVMTEKYPGQFTPPGEVETENVWIIKASDDAKYFYARDFSGMFQLKKQSDPAYVNTLDYPVGEEVFEDDWLWQRRSFMQVLPYTEVKGKEKVTMRGVAVQPWRACELLPHMLGADAPRIRADSQWRSLYRVTRAIAEVECDGFFDRMQGYDRVNLSVPLFHYTVAIDGNPALRCELGGMLAWLRYCNLDIANLVESAGLMAYQGEKPPIPAEKSYTEPHWADDEGWGKNYESGSGAGCVKRARAIGAVSIGTGTIDRAADMAFLRHPHFHYRMTMLLRTEPSLRIALWKLAVHRLRNLAWTRINGLPASLAKRKVLGQILTSELAMAIVTRLHIFAPATMVDKVKKAITKAWNDACRAHSDEMDQEREITFQRAFCQYFFHQPLDATLKEWNVDDRASNLGKLPAWPLNVNENEGFSTRLRQPHLEGNGQAVHTDPQPPRLSWLPNTSPFWKSHDADRPQFADPAEGLDRDGDFKDTRHPALPMRYPEIEVEEQFDDLGTHIPNSFLYSSADATAQCVRETLASRTAAFVLSNGAPLLNPRRLERRIHGNGQQFWARRHIGEMREAGHASALLIGIDTIAPSSKNSLWALDAAGTVGTTIRAFDWRNGMQSGVPFAQVTAEGLIASSDDRYRANDPASFGAVAIGPLPRKTFQAFALAFAKATGASHVDSFSVTQATGSWTLVLGGLRQNFPVKHVVAAAPSELGLFIEYLAWRHATPSDDFDGWHGTQFDALRNLGFDAWVPKPATESALFLRQAWPAVARGALPIDGVHQSPAPLDELELRSAPHLWNAPEPLQHSSSGAVAAALLTWPSLYRMRELLKESQSARRAIYDLWRMGMRAALSLNMNMLVPQFAGKTPRAYQLFQGEASVAMLACWRYLDINGLRDAFAIPDKPVGVAANAWFREETTRKDFSRWDGNTEHAFVWQVVVPAIKDPAIRAVLASMAPPLPASTREYSEQLEGVIDLQDLDSTVPPVPQIDYSAVLLRQPAANVGLGLLTSDKTMSALPGTEMLASSEFQIGGILPMLNVDGTFRAVPLMLPQPVQVRLSQGVPQTVQVATYWGRDGAAETREFDTFDITEPFVIEADVSTWLGPLADDISLTLLAIAAEVNGAFTLRLGLRLESPWLLRALEWSYQVLDLHDIGIVDGPNGRELVWRFPFTGLADAAALPFAIDPGAAIELAIGLHGGEATVRFSAHAAWFALGLGSPVASLRMEAETGELAFDADLLAGTAKIGWPASFAAYLALELAALPGEAGSVARVVPIGDPDTGVRVPPFDILLGRFPAPGPAIVGGAVDEGLIETPAVSARLSIDLTDLKRPRIPAWLFESGAAEHRGNPRSRLLDIAAGWLEGAENAAGAFLEASAPPVIAMVDGRLQLTLPVHFDVAGLQSEASLVASCAVEQSYLVLRGDSFACALSSITLTATGGVTHDLGSIARIALPSTVHARLTLDGSDPGSCFRLLVPAESESPVLTIPATGGIRFEISEFALGSAGLTLSARVRRHAVELDIPVLQNELAVQEAKNGLGEFRIERGRLVSASLQAAVRLKVFDDADGILTMRLAQDEQGLAIMADLDIGVARTFHLRALYLQVIVASVNLSLRYGANDGSWSARGGLTGSVRFVPEGPMFGRLEEYRSLFDGTSVHFENMDLAHLGDAPITVMVTPRTFEVGSLFAVTWRGFVLQRPGDLGSFMGLRLLGDIALRQRLPKLRVALTLGDIAIRQLRADSLIPKISISSIGLEIGVSGGFAFKGRITEFDDAQEFGFGGEVELRSEVFPPMQAMLKLTRLKEDPSQPSIAVYASTERNDPLGYGFFLRRVGLGVGIHQGLRGFSDPPGVPTERNIAARVERALDDPRGLPYPAHLSSWQALSPGQRPEYLLVAYLLVTLGLLKPDVDHPLTGSAVLAIDENLDIILGLNGWFITSPDNAGNDEYIARPAIKGALALSPREQRVYGRFMTLPNPKFGPSADQNPAVKMLADALAVVRVSVSMYADPRGALVEVGWPRTARFETSLGPAKGWAEAGFRFGFYRGTQVVGLNLAVQAEISGGISQDMGFANVALSVLARFQLQATFAGAVTSAGRYYVLAGVTLSALLEISARVYKQIRISGWGFSYTHTLFDISATLGITATASLQTALVPSGLGFDGSVDVHIRVAGFGIGARVRISSSEGRITEARNTIAALVPPIGELIGAPSPQPATSSPAEPVSPIVPAALALALAVSPPAPALPAFWHCHVVRTGDELRVVLFPDAAEGAGYPAQPAPPTGNPTFQPRTHRLCLNSTVADAFIGVVGNRLVLPAHVSGSPLDLTLVESASDVLLPKTWLTVHRPDAPRDIFVGDVLADIAAMTTEAATEEVVDPRTIHPVAGDFDDPAVLADPSRRSTRFRRRYGSDGVLTYDDHLRRAAEIGSNDPPTTQGGTSSGELLLQLLNMARDATVQPGAPIPVPASEDAEYHRHLLASRLGLVLAFHWSEPLEADLSERGILALLDPSAAAPQMFGQTVASSSWSSAATRRGQFQIVPGYAFQGKGEVGLVWSVLRTGIDGKANTKGPGNHDGIAAFRVQRKRDAGSGLPPSACMQVIPAWIKYTRERTVYYVRPQFQFHDNTLPLTGTAQVEYLVEALADDGIGETVIARQEFRVEYKAPANPFALTRAQAVLRLPPESQIELAPYRLELLVHIEVDLRATPEHGWQLSTASQARLASRIEVWRHPVASGVLERYAQGHDGQVSVSWSQYGAEHGGKSGLALPEADQARQLTVDDFDLSADAVTGLTWVPHTVVAPEPDPAPPAAENIFSLAFRGTVDIRPGNETADWDRLLGAGANAAELHVRLAPDPGGPGIPPELATALLRCRVAITRGNSTETDELVEGTEVAALERVPLGATLIRTPEWLAPVHARFGAEVTPSVTDAPSNEINLRLRGVINHQRDATHPYGAVVGYRVWTQDRLDDPAATPIVLADFLVEPEGVYRAAPLAVVPRPLPGATLGETDWRLEGESLCIPPVLPEPVMTVFEVQSLHGGSEAALHIALVDLARALVNIGFTVHCHCDEPLWPALEDDEGTRLANLLARTPVTTDVFGWRLLEALGGCATLWVTRDDDQLGIEAWKNVLDAAGSSVVSMGFSRLPPGERPDCTDRPLYGVRIFARAMLAEMLAIDVAADSVATCLERPGSQLAAALRLIAPSTGAGIPVAWVTYVETLLSRIGSFIRPAIGDMKVKLRAAMWQRGGIALPRDAISATGAAQRPGVLPVLEGQVHFFHTMETGFARELDVAVEIVRRYDLTTRRIAPDFPLEIVHDVPVPRTHPLEPERWAVAPEPGSGTLNAIVAVHPAQRLVQYRADLANRVQFIEQRVSLRRATVPALEMEWNAMFEALGDGFNRETWQSSWVGSEPLGSRPPLSDWNLPRDGNSPPALRGCDTYRFANLPPFYHFGVQVRTQAGVRHSAEGTSSNSSYAMAEPMFTTGAGLAYPGPVLKWELEGDVLSLGFALMRGVDAMREPARSHWIARDATWQSGAGDETPLLQLPDPCAQYCLVATGRLGDVSGDAPPLRVELVWFELRGGQIATRLLLGNCSAATVGGGADVQEVPAQLVQLDEPEKGRIGVMATVDLSRLELVWLRSALGSGSPDWWLALEVRRGGIDYRSEGDPA